MQLSNPLYYLHNFEAMIDTLQLRDAELLAADEREFMATFTLLQTNARALLVRMIMRKGELFRASRLKYDEIALIEDALIVLKRVGWLDDCPRLGLDDVFRLLSKAELARQFKIPRHVAARSKSIMLENLRAQAPEPRCIEQWCNDLHDRVFRLTINSLCERLRLMFFGNFRQTLTEFILADLGVRRFEKIEFTQESRPFRTREQVDAFLKLYRCREMLHAGAEPASIENLLPPSVADCEWLLERRERLRFEIARLHERAGSSSAALAIYLDCTHPEACARADRLRHRLAGIPKRRVARKSNPPEWGLTLGRPAKTVTVETAVRLHLEATANEATSVHHVENGLITSLFGLLCWNAVFCPLPGAFFHSFHHAPADFTSARFGERRSREFGQCLDELRSDAYKTTIRRNFREKSGVSSPFVAWGLLNAELLETALQCFPADHLAAWFNWILRDVMKNRCGFPDLVQFWPVSARYRLIEVKGPGDRLQDNQRRCLAYCLTYAIPVSVCQVRWHERVA